jgi:hypothetical protein
MDSSLMKARLAFIVGVLALTTSSSAAPLSTGNLLRDPSGEQGGFFDWVRQFPEPRLVSEPVSLPSGTLQATDGDYWFMAERRIRTQAGDLGALAESIEFYQTVDILPFISGPAVSVTVGGDYFAVSQIFEGHGTALLRPDNFLRFDHGGPAFASTVFPHSIPADSPLVLHDVRITVPLPSGVTAIEFTARSSFGFSTPDRTSIDGLGIVGIDDLYLSVAYVPEPTTVPLFAALLALWLLAQRIRQRRTQR